MSAIKLFIITALSLTLWTCGDNPNGKKNIFSIGTDAKNNTIALGETIKLSVQNPKNKTIKSISYKLDAKPIDENFNTKDMPLGKHTITAIVAYDETTEEASTTLTILNNAAPKIYSYKIVNEYPHDITSYTQGLEFYNGILYESTGQYGESKLRKIDYKTGEVLKNVNLGTQFFGEGLTIMNDKIYQLTWKENIGFIYDTETLEKTGSFNYGKSKEGWGLGNDGKVIYKTDGTNNIWKLNSETLAEEDHIQIYTNTGKIDGLNELEFINGKIYANIYQRNGVLIINPENGAVEGVIDFSPLQKLVKQHPELDVLNGIAYNPDTKTIFVTGKDWDKMFEVEVFVK
ncbi:glutamine cyclotransferase [Gelidibacter algens]|jgi:glutamine cyclotransferase|uniref:Glutamine cyclotransferase n=1 Tax=Gelidibacter algens TaxID=49280 RepID=A0A1A7R455_9FLAO|nr:glutaminyl-peptide cyclotransferase [Gelidibacter algens]OBX26293.1 glutamine cyclotransferase [Gelidibacter algens]RAJ24822.1 glutamine cyclotransferase [Gelidibacter algens]